MNSCDAKRRLILGESNYERSGEKVEWIVGKEMKKQQQQTENNLKAHLKLFCFC